MKLRFLVVAIVATILTPLLGHILADGAQEVAAAEPLSRMCVFLFDDTNGDGKRKSEEPLVNKIPAVIRWANAERKMFTGECLDGMPTDTYNVGLVSDEGYRFTTFQSVSVYLVGRPIEVWFGRQKKPATSSSSVTNIYLDPRLTFQAIDSVASKKGDSQFTLYVKALVYSESGGLHYNPDGSVKMRVNGPGSVDKGLFQVNSFWHPELSDADARNPEKNLYFGMELAWNAWIRAAKVPLKAAEIYKGIGKAEYAQRVVNYMKSPPKGADGKPLW